MRPDNLTSLLSPCVNCGEDFKLSHSSSRKKYCSNACRQEHHRRKKEEAALKKYQYLLGRDN